MLIPEADLLLDSGDRFYFDRGPDIWVIRAIEMLCKKEHNEKRPVWMLLSAKGEAPDSIGQFEEIRIGFRFSSIQDAKKDLSRYEIIFRPKTEAIKSITFFQ